MFEGPQVNDFPQWLTYSFFSPFLLCKDCTQRTHFENEIWGLSVLEDETPKLLSLNGSCQVVSSQYIDCNGKKTTVMAAMADPVFNIEWDSGYTYSFEVSASCEWYYWNRAFV